MLTLGMLIPLLINFILDDDKWSANSENGYLIKQEIINLQIEIEQLELQHKELSELNALVASKTKYSFPVLEILHNLQLSRPKGVTFSSLLAKHKTLSIAGNASEKSLVVLLVDALVKRFNLAVTIQTMHKTKHGWWEFVVYIVF